MTDFKTNTNTKIFIEAVNSLKLRFPVSQISKELGYDKGNISNFLNGKKPIPNDFLDNFLTTFKLNKEQFTENNFTPEGRVLKGDEYYKKTTFIVPVKGRGGLENAMYDTIMFDQLEKEETTVKRRSSNGSTYFKIEVEGISMDNGAKHSLAEGDWAYCRSIAKKYWRTKFHTNEYEIFCFFHNERGIIFKKIKDQNIETGELLLESLHPDKKKFPDFTIRVYECSYICNVTRIVTDL